MLLPACRANNNGLFGFCFFFPQSWACLLSMFEGTLKSSYHFMTIKKEEIADPYLLFFMLG